ncbi:hypothetical protein GCM10020000_69270 [Streptomyces olivoverticillatus]
MRSGRGVRFRGGFGLGRDVVDADGIPEGVLPAGGGDFTGPAVDRPGAACGALEPVADDTPGTTRASAAGSDR